MVDGCLEPLGVASTSRRKVWLATATALDERGDLLDELACVEPLVDKVWREYYREGALALLGSTDER